MIILNKLQKFSPTRSGDSPRVSQKKELYTVSSRLVFLLLFVSNILISQEFNPSLSLTFSDTIAGNSPSLNFEIQQTIGQPVFSNSNISISDGFLMFDGIAAGDAFGSGSFSFDDFFGFEFTLNIELAVSDIDENSITLYGRHISTTIDGETGDVSDGPDIYVIVISEVDEINFQLTLLEFVGIDLPSNSSITFNVDEGLFTNPLVSTTLDVSADFSNLSDIYEHSFTIEIADCNGDFIGSAFFDECGVCSEGNSGNTANSDDIGCGCFLSEAENYWPDVDLDGAGFDDETDEAGAMYCTEGGLNTEQEGPNTDYPPVFESWVTNADDQCPNDSGDDEMFGDNDGDSVCDSDDACQGFDDSLNNDADELPDACDDDDDNDGLADIADWAPYDNNLCSDYDADGCDDCSSGTYNPSADGDDVDTDGLCDIGDNCIETFNPGQGDNDSDGFGDLCDDDDDNDGCADSDDDNPLVFSENYDNDEFANDCDIDDDNDGVTDGNDSDPLNEFVCSDTDGDSCEDCSSGSYDPANDGDDFDSDGLCDAGDDDDDNDTVLDAADADSFDPYVCQDTDEDTCDDCSQEGIPNTSNDGADNDGDGLCDDGDPDDDNDMVLDINDISPFYPFACIDTDEDTCDDCSYGSYDPANDGDDYDGDNQCDAGDDDDDNDGVADGDDSDSLNEFVCSDADNDTCDDCFSGSYDPLNDGPDFDYDVICDAGDTDDDNDGISDGDDSDPLNEFVCSDTDGDSCEDCSSGSYNPENDGDDSDSDGFCDAGDPWPECPDDGTNPYDECGICSGDDIECTGCTDPDAVNWDPIFIIDDGSCLYEQIFLFENYNNLISFNVIPVDNSVDNVFSDICENVGGLIGQGIASQPLNCGEPWVGSLQNILPTQGYWLNIINPPQLLTVIGAPVDPDYVLDFGLDEGWNLISYPYFNGCELSEALPDDVECSISGIIGQGEAAVQTSCFNWIGSLDEWSPGSGYWVNVEEGPGIVFNFEECDLTRSDLVVETSEPPTHFQTTQSTEQAFYFVEDITMEGLLGSSHWLLSYCNNELVGTRYWTGEPVDIPAMGDDGSEETSSYCDAGDIPQFKLYDEITNEIIDLVVENIPGWESNGIFILGNVTTLDALVLSEFTLSPAYPNPFNPVTTINFGIPSDTEVSLVVYDMLGREADVLYNGKLKSGYHSYQWDARLHASGVYILQMSAGSEVITQKLLLMK